MLDDTMKMRNILSERETGQGITISSTCPVCRHDTDKLNTVYCGTINDGATTDAINSNTVNKVSLEIVSPCADSAGEKAQSPRLNGGVAKPRNLNADVETCVYRTGGYQVIWQIK